MFKLVNFTEAPVTREEIHKRQKAWAERSLLLGDSRTERHNSYARHEATAVAHLYPRGDRVENVVPIRPQPEAPRPAA